MHGNKFSPQNCADAAGDIAVDLYPFLRKYKDGRIERLLGSSFVPASEDAATNRGVATRDVTVDDGGSGVSARLFLPWSGDGGGGRGRGRLPLVVYMHGGSFCTESAFGGLYHGYATSLASRTRALVVSVEYCLAPEHPVPAAYDDAWAALRWAASRLDPWLAEHADPRRTFVAGDSAGSNIAFHTCVTASRDGAMDIEGLVMVHPFFWGAEKLPSEKAWDRASMFHPRVVDRLWPLVTAGKAGNDDHRVDPTNEEISSLSCRLVLVAVAEMDPLCDRSRRLAARMRGDVTAAEGEDHVFHLRSPMHATSRKLMEIVVQFINQSAPSPPCVVAPERRARNRKMPKAQLLLSVPSRPYKSVFLSGLRPNPSKSGFGLFFARAEPTSCGAHMDPLSASVSWSIVAKNL